MEIEETIEEEIIGIDLKKVPQEWKWVIDCGLLTKNGLRLDGLGVLMSNSKKTVQLLDKIQKFEFFSERRQKNWHQEFQKLNKLPIEQDFETK